MRVSGDLEMVAVLKQREHQYTSMIHYIEAQRAAADGRPLTAAARIVTHPSTYGLLLRRIAGRVARTLQRKLGADTQVPVAAGAKQ